MASETYVIDSVVVIDHLNGHGEATRFLAATSDTSHITAITFAEVLAGYDAGPTRDVRASPLFDGHMIGLRDGAGGRGLSAANGLCARRPMCLL